jgi:phosphatidylglycerophosphate synthase
VSLQVWLEGWQQLHGVAPTPLVRRWLALVHRLAAPLARTGVHPDVLTLGSLVAAGAVLAVPAWAGVPLVLASALLDGLDGCVAVLQGRASRWGSVLDSTVDRCCDVLFVLAMVSAGGSIALGFGCAFAVLLLEYVRARAGEVLVVTVAERPTRVLVTVFALGLSVGEVGLWVLLGLTAVGVVQLGVALRRVT